VTITKRKNGANSVVALLKNTLLKHYFLWSIVLFGLLTQPSFAAEQGELRIAVAANFTPVLKKLLPDFHLKTGIKTQIISGASGAMFLQIKHGAPFDIFLSADSRRPEQLDRDDLILAKSRKTYALGQLALFSHGNLTELEQLKKAEKLSNLTSGSTRFAIANPRIAPYGKAAKESLQYLGLWQDYQNILITGINITQTFNQIRSRAVNTGIVANSQLVLNNLTGVIIPSDHHLPIKQQLVILKRSKHQQQARQLSDFLLSPKTQKIIASYGYINAEQGRH
jgi:molybdate transport system substrate-binding protein